MEACEAANALWLPTGEDEAVVQDLLKYLEDSDARSDSPATTVRTTSSSGPDVSERKRTYKRRMEQIQELKDEAMQLEMTVKRLRLPEETWRDVIARQLALRQRAQVDNQRLRELQQEHRHLLQQLKRVVCSRVAQIKITLGWRGDTVDPATLSEDWLENDTTALESVTSALLPMYFQTEWVLARPELQSDGCTGVLKTLPVANQTVFEWLDSWTVPFDLPTTSKAVEMHLVSQLGSQYEASPPLGCVQQSQQKEWVEIPGFECIARITMAFLRFDEEDRVVFVRDSVFTLLDPDGSNEYIVVPGLSLRQSLWTIVQRIRFPGQDTPSASKIMRFGLTVPCFVPNCTGQSREIDQFLRDVSLQFYEFAHDDVDNRLLSGKGASPYRAAVDA